MIGCTYLLFVLSLLLAPARGKAEDSYTIKLKESSKGEKNQVTKQSTEKTTIRLEDSQGNILQDKEETKFQKSSYQETVLEKPAGKTKADRLSRSYDLAETGTGDDKRMLPYQGKTVLIEKRGDRYHFQIEEGEELTGKNAEILEREFNQRKGDELDFNRILTPKNPVRVGETWELDTQALCRDLEKTGGMEVDAAKSKASAKLVKAYKQDGRQFGVIQVHLDFSIKALKQGEQRISLGQGAIFLADATMEGCIDGSVNTGAVKFTIRMEGQGELAQGEMKFKLTFKTNISGQEAEKQLAVK